MSTIDTFQSGLPIPLLTFCSKLIDRSATCPGRLLDEGGAESAVGAVVAVVVNVSTPYSGPPLRGRSKKVPVVWERCNHYLTVCLDILNWLAVADTDVPLSNTPTAGSL